MRTWKELAAQAERFGQTHLFDHAATLSAKSQQLFRQQVQQLDFAALASLFKKSQQTEAQLDLSKLTVPDIVRLPRAEQDRLRDREAQTRGEAALGEGRIAIILVAGGQGTRLGHDAPKGTYPIGPVTQRSLFQIHAEKVLALSRRYERDIPLLIMTSQENDADTQVFFAQHRHFGLKPSQVTFFMQGMLPALDAKTGKVLLRGQGEMALSPNGHGGVIEALHEGGHLDKLSSQGATDCYYFQVDNPLTKVADPVFLGHHLAAQAEMSLKVLAKLYATERLGNLVQLEGRSRIIEYTELPEQLARELNADGELRIWAGSPAIHVFSLAFLQRLGRGEIELPYHVARKAVAWVDENGVVAKPAQANALKFERFVFDALPLAERVVAVETSRFEEFEPVKNAEGENSPKSARQALSDNYAAWLEAAGAKVARDEQGHAAAPLEISPLVAISADQLVGKIPPGTIISQTTVWS